MPVVSLSLDRIFLDAKMPEMGGIEALEQIRKSDKNIPIIIITSSTREAAIEAMAKGARRIRSKGL